MHKQRDKTDLLGAHAGALEALKTRNRLRVLAPRVGLDFSSNDYLGLANSPELIGAAMAALERGLPVGATGSRLLRGNHPEHEALEADAAEHFGSQGALFFSSGFAANYAVFSTLPMRADLVVVDELIHASVHDGLMAGKAQSVSARHNDPQSFEDLIASWRKDGGTGRVWIGVESLYSMDGDRAPLAELLKIASANDAFLVVDEAHATGVYGAGGRGLAAEFEGCDNIITVHTCGKALGVMGALVCGAQPLLDYIVNRARAFVFATAPSPIVAATVRAALKISLSGDARRERLGDLVETTGHELAARCGVALSGSQIQPIIVGSDTRALALAQSMQARGYDVRAIRPPTVPVGTSRLRLSLTLNVSDKDVQSMVEALSEEIERIPQ